MHSAVSSFYQTRQENDKSSFLDVIFLNEGLEDFEKLSKQTKDLSKGWFELLNLDNFDKISFLKEFWLTNLPYSKKNHENILHFFSRIDDVFIVLTKKENEKLFSADLVYSMMNEKSFFRGKFSLNDDEIEGVNRQFLNQLPKDYLKFLKIHSSFAKTNDTGIIDARDLRNFKNCFYDQMKIRDIKSGSESINPNSLIPFYKSFDSMDFQCFYLDWYPELNLGNVFFSSKDNIISQYKNVQNGHDLAFYSFLDWLFFYLEDFETG